MRGRGLQAGLPIRPGACASPPRARSWETGTASPVGELARYPGALYYDRMAGKGYICVGASVFDWVDVGFVRDLANWELVIDIGVNPKVAPGLAAQVGSIARRVDGAAAYLKILSGDTDWMGVDELRLARGMFVYVLDNWDPVTDPKAASVGAIARSYDGAKAWLKYGSDNSAWRSVGEKWVSFDTGASAVMNFDVTQWLPGVAMLIPQTSRVEVSFVPHTLEPADWAMLRLNGARVVGKCADIANGVITNGTGFRLGVTYPDGVLGNCTIYPTVGGVRKIVCTYTSLYDAQWCGMAVGAANVGVISSIGAGSSGAYIGPHSTMEVRECP